MKNKKIIDYGFHCDGSLEDTYLYDKDFFIGHKIIGVNGKILNGYGVEDEDFLWKLLNN